MPGVDPKAARTIFCPSCKNRVQRGRGECATCGISLVSGSYQTRVGGTYAVRDTSRTDPRLFLLILVVGLVALFSARGPLLAQDALAWVNNLLHTNIRP